MSLELMILIVLSSTFFLLWLGSKKSDKNKQGLARIKNYVESQLKSFTHELESKKQEYEEMTHHLETLLLKGNAIDNLLEKHIEQMNEKLVQVSQSSDFIQQNTDKMAEMTQYIASLEAEVENIHHDLLASEKLRSQIQDLSTYYLEAHREIDQLSNELENTLKNRYQNTQKEVLQFVDKAQEDFQSYLDKIAQDYHLLWERKIESNQQNFEKWIEKQQTISDQMHQNTSLALEEITGMRENLLKQWQQEIDSLKYSVERNIGVLDQKYDKFHQSLENLDQRVGNIRHNITRLEKDYLGYEEKFKNKLEDQSVLYQQKIQEKWDMLQNQLDQVDKSAMQLISDFMDQVGLQIEEIEKSTAGKVSEQRNFYTQSYEEILVQMKYVRDELQGNLQNIKKDMQKELTNFQNQIQLQRDYLLDEEKNILGEIHKHVDQKLDQLVEKTNNFQEKVERLDVQYKRESDTLSTKMEYYNQKMNDIESKTQSMSADLSLFYQNETNRIDQFMQEYFEKIKKDMEKDILVLKEDSLIPIQETSQEFQTSLDHLYEKLAQYRANFDIQIENMEKSLKDHQRIWDNDIRSQFIPQQKQKMQSLFENLKQELQNKVFEDIDLATERIQYLLQQSEIQKEQFETYYQNMEEEYAQKFKTQESLLRDKIQSTIIENDSRWNIVKDKLDGMKTQFDYIMKESKQYIAENIENIKEEVFKDIQSISEQLHNKEIEINREWEIQIRELQKKEEYLEKMLKGTKDLLFKEIGKTGEDIQSDILHIYGNAEEQVNRMMREVREELHHIQNVKSQASHILDDIKDELYKKVQDNMEQYSEDTAKKISLFEKELKDRSQMLDKLFQGQELELQEKIGNMSKEIEKISNIVRAYETNPKMQQALEDLANIESTVHKIERQNQYMQDIDRKYGKMRKDVDQMLQAIGTFEAKKEELEELNHRIQDMVIRSKELDERTNIIQKKSVQLDQLESKLRSMQILYEQIQEKSRTIEAKERKIQQALTAIEHQQTEMADMDQFMKSFQKELEKGYQKSEMLQQQIMQLQLELEKIHSGEEKIDFILSKFGEIEILSKDIELRLNQLNKANDRLDLAEKRVNNLFEMVDDPQFLERVVDKSKKMLSISQDAIPQNKIDAILRYRSNGFNPSIIANILELSVAQVQEVLKNSKNKSS